MIYKMGDYKMKQDTIKGFTGNAEALDKFTILYNEFAEKLEELGADSEMFQELSLLCAVSRDIYA